MKSKKLASVWYWDRASQILPNWRDGLRAAIEEIEKKHKVDWFLDKRIPQKDEFDAIVFWDDSNSTFFEKLSNYPKAKKGIFLTSDNNLNLDNLRKLDVVFCESQPVLEKVLAGGAKGILAFGTDTDFYKPDPKIKKDIEYFYPATFSPWKKMSEIAYLGSKLWCTGTIQPDGYGELEACEKTGVHIEIGYFPAEHIRDLYRRAKKVIIPAVHGSERTILEALSMNIVPEVTNPINVRARSYIEEYRQERQKNPRLTPREFVIKNYSHKVYARQILKGVSLK